MVGGGSKHEKMFCIVSESMPYFEKLISDSGNQRPKSNIVSANTKTINNPFMQIEYIKKAIGRMQI